MIRHSDDDFDADGVGEGEGGSASSSPVPTDSSSREPLSYHPRPFTAWPTARERDESLWARTRARIARLFGRGGASNNGHDPEVDTGGSVSPPDDFQFPWSRVDEPSAMGDGDVALNRGRRQESDLPLLEPFDSVDEALPVSDESSGLLDPVVSGDPHARGVTEEDTDPMLEPPTQPSATEEVPRPRGLFARLFGRSKEPVTAEEEGPRASEEINAAFLVSKFRAFYNEVLNQKHQGTAITAGFATAILTQDEAFGESPEQAAHALSARLQQMLELQQAEATWMGGESAARYHDAQYAMAVLADETLSTVDWKGKSAWPQFSLEQRLFKSSSADLEFFKRIDRLFKEGAATHASRDLARVFLLTLAAGFRGKYGMFGLTRALHEYRQRLFEYIHDGDALLLYADDRAIFPEAASRTIAGRATARVSSAQRWVVVLIVLVLGYAVLAHLAWNRASSELRDVTTRVEATHSQGAR